MAERQQTQGTLAADGSSDWVVGRGNLIVSATTTRAGEGNGTYGSGTLTLCMKVNGKEVPVMEGTSAVAFTEESAKSVRFPETASTEVRLTLPGSSSPSIDYRLAFDRP